MRSLNRNVYKEGIRYFNNFKDNKEFFQPENNHNNTENNQNNNYINNEYYNPFRNNIPNPNPSSLPSETTLQVNEQLDQYPESFIGLRQNQEQINLLKRIANLLNTNNRTEIYFRGIMLIFLAFFYVYLAYDFSDANGFSLRSTRDLFLMSFGLFIIFFILSVLNIYGSINKIKN